MSLPRFAAQKIQGREIKQKASGGGTGYFFKLPVKNNIEQGILNHEVYVLRDSKFPVPCLLFFISKSPPTTYKTHAAIPGHPVPLVPSGFGRVIK